MISLPLVGFLAAVTALLIAVLMLLVQKATDSRHRR